MFFTKSAISSLVSIYACCNLVAKSSTINLLTLFLLCYLRLLYDFNSMGEVVELHPTFRKTYLSNLRKIWQVSYSL